MSLTGTDYRRYDPKRACDICGHMWHKSELTRIAPFRWACPDDKDGLTAEDISRHNASVRPLMVKSVKNAKGISQTPTYQQAEASVFNLVLSKAPNFIFSNESGLLGAQQDSLSGFGNDKARPLGWFCYYLSNLVLENRRPSRWISQASTMLATLADQIVAGQNHVVGIVPVLADEDYGAVNTAPVTNATFDVPGNGACLLGLLGAYRALGARKYLLAARAIATFLIRAQSVGLYSAFYSQYAPGVRITPGPFPDVVRLSLTTLLNSPVGAYNYSMSGTVCAWALNALKNVDGDASYSSATTTANSYAQSTVSTLSAAIANCVSWWENGAIDANGTAIVGFGPATPKQGYTGGVNGGFPGNASWNSTPALDGSISIYGFEYAMGVRALYEIGGFTSQVSALYSWLRSFTSNPANQIPTGWDRLHSEKSTLGTYDPTTCLARTLQVKDASGNAVAREATENEIGGSYNAPMYDWRTVGILAPLQSIQARADLGVAKDILSANRHRRFYARLSGGLPTTTVLSTSAYDRCDLQDDLGSLGVSGLNFQTSVGMRRPGWSGNQFGHYVDLVGAVQAADCYRYAPQAFPLEQG